jgi:signal transduction histidine kinase
MVTRFEKFLRQQREGVLLMVALILVLIIGTIDWLSGYVVSMSLFYGIPIMFAVWVCDKKSGFLIAIACGITWWWADILAGHVYHNILLAIWEPTARFGYFTIVAVGGAAFKERHDAVRARIELLERSQRLEREIIEISEREQRRIGRDLHDGLCQYFAAIGCGVASLRADLLQQNLPDEAATAAELADLLNNGVVQARELARGLVPVHMGEAGLAAALGELAASVARLHEIECGFALLSDVEITDASAATHLYRIAQEAINNATRHGHASRIGISLIDSGGFATLQIVDNGAGISHTSHGGEGLGINIMGYRARLVGGHLTLTELPEGGTVITCVFPHGPRDIELDRAAA